MTFSGLVIGNMLFAALFYIFAALCNGLGDVCSCMFLDSLGIKLFGYFEHAVRVQFVVLKE